MKTAKVCNYFCRKCNTHHVNVITNETLCDTCGKQLSINGQIICEIGKNTIINLEINNTNYDFCNYSCLLQFIVEELRKQQPKGEQG